MLEYTVVIVYNNSPKPQGQYMEITILNNQRLPITLRKSKRTLSIRLQMDSSGDFILVAPWFIGNRDINIFLDKHVGWIEKQFVKIEKQKKLRPEFKYCIDPSQILIH